MCSVAFAQTRILYLSPDDIIARSGKNEWAVNLALFLVGGSLHVLLGGWSSAVSI